MSAQFDLYLGEQQIPVINWVNRHGPPEGRELRFTVPTEVKAKLESHLDATFRLARGGEAWDFEVLSVMQHCTGTNGVRATGRVRSADAAPVVAPTPAPVAEVVEVAEESPAETTPAADVAPAAPAGFDRSEKSSLRELLLKKKAERQALRADEEE